MSENQQPLERTSLSGQEYYALRALMGVVSTFAVETRTLEKRLRKIKMGWCRAKLIEAVADKLLVELLKTVPPKKIAQIRQEIEHTRVEVSVTRDFTGNHKQTFTYVPNDALEWLEDKVVDMECMMCEKTSKESKRCQVRRNIEALYMYDFPDRGEVCPIAHMNIERSPYQSK